jgi:hypothetical protein
MKNIFPELDGLIFPDLMEAQMCLNEYPGMPLYLRAFKVAVTISASTSWIQQCVQLVVLLFSRSTTRIAVFYSMRAFQQPLLELFARLARDSGYCAVIWSFEYQYFAWSLDGSCVFLVISKKPFTTATPACIAPESMNVESCLLEAPKESCFVFGQILHVKEIPLSRDRGSPIFTIQEPSDPKPSALN